MTQHKCGTCRFYEAGAQHGSCQNPANPRRDDVALLRPDELGCRAGWGKDYWVAATALVGAADTTADADGDPTQPIPRVTGDAPSISATQSTPPASVMPTGGPARLRRGVQGPVVAPLGGMEQVPSAAKDADVKRETSLDNHPELNEQGIPYRNSTKRSSVAEAHRRALARREKERLAKEEREQVRASEYAPSPAQVGPVAPSSATTTPVGAAPASPTSRPPIAPMPRPSLRPIGIKDASEKVELPQRPTLPLPAASPRAPMMPRPAQPAAQVEPEHPVVVARDEAVDRVITDVAPPVVAESPRDTATIPSAPIEPAAPSIVESPTLPIVETPIARVESQDLADRDPVPAPEPAPGARARYWHEMPSTGQYTRMELPPTQGGGQREAAPIGRTRPERQISPPPTAGRRIRTMEEARNGTPAPAASSAPVERPAVQAPQSAPPRAAAASQPVAAPPPTPEAAPRQIDEALLQQLETNWRTQELAAHAGQSCGNCRFFRPTEGGQGNCGCSFSNVYGRPIEPQSLSCLDGLGTWWAATDDGWLERTERRPRRATPLLDALLREHEEELARSMPERRRAR